MTNPGDSDQWWKQYGGAGVSPESGAGGSVEQPSAGVYEYPSLESMPEPLTEYPSQIGPQPPPPQYPNYQQPSDQGGDYGYQQQPYPSSGYYGYQAPAAYPPSGYPNQQGNNGLAIAALCLSLASFTTCGCTGILGIVLGAMALGQVDKTGQRGRGIALGGIWIGVGSILWFVVYTVIIFIVE